MRKNLLLMIVSCLLFGNLLAQIKSEIPKERILDWSKAGLTQTIPTHNKKDLININSFVGNDSTYDNALVKAIKSKAEQNLKVIYFPKGNYIFTKPIKLRSNIVLLGDGSQNSKLVFQLNKKKANAIVFIGKSIKTFQQKKNLNRGITKLTLAKNIEQYSKANIVEIYQGKNEWGKSSSGKEKQYQKGQVIKILGIYDNEIQLSESLRLSYSEKDKWGEPIIIKLVNAVTNSGIENLSIERKDKPPKNGGNIVAFQYAYNCWVSGVESKRGANNHVSVNHSANIEIRGSVFSKTFNTGGGGNGYGIVVGGNTTDCLFEDNIFTELRHAMIIASGANGNVFGYNASFNKPILNIDEASISVHGHYPYMNLFESNYVEYINVDYVWGVNGEYNTFLRNFVYHKGVFGLFRNQELQVERGTNKTNIIGNLANISARGNDNFILKNMAIDKLSNSMYLETYSFYHKEKPNFISEKISWPCFGLKISAKGNSISNIIPAMERFNLSTKTVSVKEYSKTPKSLKTRTKELKNLTQ